jgi:hypothetical protein
MTSATVLHHAALAAAVVALGAAGLRVAASLGAAGLARVVAGVVLAAAAAVAEALVLGLVDLGTDTYALTAAALGTWLGARALLPDARGRAHEEIAATWARLGTAERIALGAAFGVWAAWTLWLLRHPFLGHDMVLYHVPEAVSWVHNGQPGSIVPVINDVPVANYPVTYEVMLAWGMGLARSFVPVTLIVAAMPLLIAAAAWLGLRTLGVGRLPAGLAGAALVATPAVFASQHGGASLDPAALAWLLSCASLCAAARENPRLLAPALVAGALAIGTKTTAAPLTVVALALAVYALRDRLRGVAVPLAAATAAAAAVGGFWYLRNLVQHGSPLWPFLDAPWGDPRPQVYEAADVRFLDRPGTTLDRLGGYYWDHFGGPIILLAGAVVAAIVARTRAVSAAAIAAGVSVLIWTNAPFTGVVDEVGRFDIGTGDATRYLLPGAAVAALALALATRRGGLAARVGLAGLAAAAVAGALNSLALGFPSSPSATTPLAGAIVGGIAAALAERVAQPLAGTGRRLAAPVIAALAVVVVAPFGALAADGYVERYAASGGREAPVVRWLIDQPPWRDEDGSVVATWSLIGPTAGDRLQHRLELLSPAAACDRAGTDASTWVVIDRPDARARGHADCDIPPVHEDDWYRGYPPGRGR